MNFLRGERMTELLDDRCFGVQEQNFRVSYLPVATMTCRET